MERPSGRRIDRTIEDIPLPGAAVNVIISNCVINLSVDEPAVPADETRRLLQR
jgi:arsenite methyltransferase